MVTTVRNTTFFSHLKLREGEIVRTDYFKKVITSLQLCHVQPLLTSNLGFVSLMILNLSHSPGFALDTGKKIKYLVFQSYQYQNFNNLTQVFSESEDRKILPPYLPKPMISPMTCN